MQATSVVRSTQTPTKIAPMSKLRPLNVVLKETQEKIQEDLIRFRTCCADPRASK